MFMRSGRIGRDGVTNLRPIAAAMLCTLVAIAQHSADAAGGRMGLMRVCGPMQCMRAYCCDKTTQHYISSECSVLRLFRVISDTIVACDTSLHLVVPHVTPSVEIKSR
jgi:hypothetical protein